MAPASRRGSLAVAAGVTAAVVVLDQLTKDWALDALRARTIDVVWTLRFNLTFNSGIAFGQAEGIGPIVAVAALVAVVVLAVAVRRRGTMAMAVASGLVAGGALGNLVDRAFRDGAGGGFLGGRVVDFIDLQWWPVFNVADMGVTLGALALVFLGLRADTRPPAATSSADDVADGADRASS